MRSVGRAPPTLCGPQRASLALDGVKRAKTLENGPKMSELLAETRQEALWALLRPARAGKQFLGCFRAVWHALCCPELLEYRVSELGKEK